MYPPVPISQMGTPFARPRHCPRFPDPEGRRAQGRCCTHGERVKTLGEPQTGPAYPDCFRGMDRNFQYSSFPPGPVPHILSTVPGWLREWGQGRAAQQKHKFKNLNLLQTLLWC